MSIHDDLDGMDIVDLDYISDSPSELTSPSTNNQASSDSPSKSVPTMLPLNDNPSIYFSTLDSFIPILRKLPDVYIDQNLYYIGESVAAEDWALLSEYTRRVSHFIVTDANTDWLGRPQAKKQISLAALLRFSRHQLPLFPFLSHITITEADASIAHLELLVTPSLRSLKASCIPDTQQSTFFSFLTSIKQEALRLQTLILGPGRFQARSLQIISQFNNLRHLELKNEDSEIPPTFFDNIGSLPKLESLILDARYVSSTVIQNQPISLPNSTLMDGKSNEHGVDDVLLSQACQTPISPSGTFNQLSKLHVIGWLSLLQNLIPRITSTRLEDVAITIICLSEDELQVRLAKEKAEKEKSDEEKRKKDEEEMEKAQSEKQRHLLGDPWGEYEFPIADPERLLKEDQERLLKEQERVTGVSVFYTVPFTQLLQMLCRRWRTSLKTVSVCQLGETFQRLLDPPTLPMEIFQELLLLHAIESLEVEGWSLDSVESVLAAAKSIPNLKRLLLPLDNTNSGISMPTLRRVAEACPKLESFQCRLIEPLILIPHPVGTDADALSHGLRFLSIGNSAPLPVYDVALHLYLLFPNLEQIQTCEEHNGGHWAIIDDLVKMCQMAREYDMNRPTTPITE